MRKFGWRQLITWTAFVVSVVFLAWIAAGWCEANKWEDPFAEVSISTSDLEKLYPSGYRSSSGNGVQSMFEEIIMDFDRDAVRYARNWRYGGITAPMDEPGTVVQVVWMAFPTPSDRASYLEDQAAAGWHVDILSEQEIAVAIGVPSREKLWEYFCFDDPDIVGKFLEDRHLGWYGKSDPRAKAPT